MGSRLYKETFPDMALYVVPAQNQFLIYSYIVRIILLCGILCLGVPEVFGPIFKDQIYWFCQKEAKFLWQCAIFSTCYTLVHLVIA